MSPHGLDVRLSLDLNLQSPADSLLKGHRGAAVLLNAQSGEIFVMASHPTFNPADLNELGTQLNKDPEKPLINRVAQGLYPLGTLIQPFVEASLGASHKPSPQSDLQNGLRARSD